ncbi:MAG: hypothetical protein ACPGU9_05385 [Flavobacteriaceae bacterium]
MYDSKYKEIRQVVGVYRNHLNGYYSFSVENADVIVFEQIDSKILKEFQLKSDRYINMIFEITYSESYDEFESDDFMIYKLEHLKLL